jgi:ketosteroid isomerase-like protein
MRFFVKLIILSIVIVSCKNETINNDINLITNTAESNKLFIATMQKHLDAVSNKDLETLKSTMSPNDEMQLILPNAEIMHSVDSFMNYHKAWFESKAPWTFETKILNTDIGKTIGMAITEIIYKEPERNGKPYFNRMIVSYVLKKIDNKWYIIKDHASTIEKTKS